LRYASLHAIPQPWRCHIRARVRDDRYVQCAIRIREYRVIRPSRRSTTSAGSCSAIRGAYAFDCFVFHRRHFIGIDADHRIGEWRGASASPVV
jgi:hypothetical protein